MSHKPDEDVVTHLVDNVTAKTLEVGKSAFARGVLPPGEFVDQKAVFVLPFSGPPPENFHGSGPVMHSVVQVWIRGDQHDYDQALILAREVRDVLHSGGQPTIAGYIDVQVTESEPLPHGEDDRGLPEFSLNVELQFEG